MSILGEEKLEEAEAVVDASLKQVQQVDELKGLSVSYLDLLFKNYKCQFGMS